PEVLNSIGGCATTSAAERAAPTLPLAAVPLPARLAVTVGSEAVARVQVRRGELPQAGVPLVLRGTSGIPGGPPQDVHARTDANGVALFRFPVGRLPATYTFDVVTAGGFSLPGTPPLELMVGPSGVAVAAVQPGRVELRAGERGPISLLVTVRDSLGNAVPGETVALQPDSPDMGVAPEARSTDSLGRVTFVVERAAIRHGGKLAIRVRGQQFGSVDVVRTDVLAPATTGFVSGIGQRGIARTRLNEPLVFQVRSSLGRPLAGKIVTFRAVNAEVGTDSVATDSAGLARVEVTLGKQAGPALVSATVDSLQRQATLSVDPAAPAGVIIERDGNRVDGGTVIATAGVAFRLRVSAQDAYGNPVPTADLARMIQKMRNRFNLQSQLLKMISVESDGGAATVTFKPVGTGAADLSIAGATVSVAIAPPR
ncbi:MAG TPA: Ig-like domain-containing protein, partial [Gemmatimonadales bacterium]|nr:Ig-like domain-containing protein [Gemmatimonadales bacterium]